MITSRDKLFLLSCFLTSTGVGLRAGSISVEEVRKEVIQLLLKIDIKNRLVLNFGIEDVVVKARVAKPETSLVSFH